MVASNSMGNTRDIAERPGREFDYGANATYVIVNIVWNSPDLRT